MEGEVCSQRNLALRYTAFLEQDQMAHTNALKQELTITHLGCQILISSALQRFRNYCVLRPLTPSEYFLNRGPHRQILVSEAEVKSVFHRRWKWLVHLRNRSKPFPELFICNAQGYFVCKGNVYCAWS